MLARAPGDAFLLYAIALEHRKSGDLAQAEHFLRLTLEKDPAYVAAYLQLGQVRVQAGDVPAARAALTEGIAAASARGEHHAASEMRQLLDMLR